MLFNSSLDLVENGQENDKARQELIARIISTYPGIIKLYCIIRFRIIPLRFLQEIEQYLPEEGDILDLGCGFGLFSLFMASCKPKAQIIGLDINERRLQIARSSALKLAIRNVRFEHQDLRDWRPVRQVAGVYGLDLFHHIPVNSGNDLLYALFTHLEPGGKFLLKDVDTKPRAMLAFTYLLDLLMSPQDHFSYRSSSAWRQQLADIGFAPIYLHHMRDVLPYPHILLICSKPKGEQR